FGINKHETLLSSQTTDQQRKRLHIKHPVGSQINSSDLHEIFARCVPQLYRGAFYTSISDY
ncbi:MAG: hypothetical protein Q4C81_10510, partial [Kocuria sp.]|nr:hypothetical protein [Kocuria sp.]